MRKFVTAVFVILLIFLLFPIRGQFKDGGSVEYRAILYTVYDVHAIYDVLHDEIEFVEGVIVEILGNQVYNSTNPHIEHFGDSPNVEK